MPNKSKSDGSISAIDTVIILSAAVGIPLFLGWVGKNPVRNMQTTESNIAGLCEERSMARTAFISN